MKRLLIATILLLGTQVKAAPSTPLEFSRMTPTRLWATKLDLTLRDVKFNDIAWVSSLDVNRSCDQLLEGVHELRIIMKHDLFTFILNGEPMHHLVDLPVIRTPRGFRVKEAPNTLWLKVPDWVTLQMRIVHEDGIKKLKMSVFRPHNHEKLTPVFEGSFE